MKKLGLLIMSGLILTGCAETYEYDDVQATIIELEHDEARTYYKTVTDFDGNTKQKRVYEPEEFEVTVQYEDLIKEFEFDDDEFYRMVELGDILNLELELGYDAEGNIVSRDINLYEDPLASIDKSNFNSN